MSTTFYDWFTSPGDEVRGFAGDDNIESVDAILEPLKLPPPLLELGLKLSLKQVKYALTFLATVNKKEAMLVAGYSGGSIASGIGATYEIAQPVVSQFMRACQEYFVDMGIMSNFEIRQRYTQVGRGEIEMTPLQLQAIEKLVQLQGIDLRKPEETSTHTLKIEHTFTTNDHAKATLELPAEDNIL